MKKFRISTAKASSNDERSNRENLGNPREGQQEGLQDCHGQVIRGQKGTSGQFGPPNGRNDKMICRNAIAPGPATSQSEHPTVGLCQALAAISIPLCSQRRRAPPIFKSGTFFFRFQGGPRTRISPPPAQQRQEDHHGYPQAKGNDCCMVLGKGKK